VPDSKLNFLLNIFKLRDQQLRTFLYYSHPSCKMSFIKIAPAIWGCSDGYLVMEEFGDLSGD